MSVDTITENLLVELKRARPFFETYIAIKEGKFFVKGDKKVDHELESMDDIYEAFPALHSLALLNSIEIKESRLSSEQKRIEDADKDYSVKIKETEEKIKANKEQINKYHTKKTRGRKEVYNNKKSPAELAEERERENQELETQLEDFKNKKSALQKEFDKIPDMIEELNDYVNSTIKVSNTLDEDINNEILEYCINISEKHGFDINESSEKILKPCGYASDKVYEFLRKNFKKITQKIKPKKTTQKVLMSDEEIDKEIEKRLEEIDPELKRTPKKESSILDYVESKIDKRMKKDVSELKSMWRSNFGKFLLIIATIAGIYTAIKLDNSGSKKTVYNEKTIVAKEEPKKTRFIPKKTDSLKSLLEEGKKLIEGITKLGEGMGDIANKVNKIEIDSNMLELFGEDKYYPFKVTELCQGTIYKPAPGNSFVVQGGEAYKIQRYNRLEKQLHLFKLQGGKIEKHRVGNVGLFLDNVPDFYFFSEKNSGFKQAIDIEKKHSKVQLLQPDGSGYRLNIVFNQHLYRELNKIDGQSFYCVLDGEKKDAREMFWFSKVYRIEPPKKLEFVVEIEKKDYKFTLPCDLDHTVRREVE